MTAISSSTDEHLSTGGKATSLIILLLLLFTIVSGTGESIHSQLLKLGATLWDDYIVLRTDLPAPSCDYQFDIESRLNALERESLAAGEEFDLFEETFDRDAARTSLTSQQQLCAEKHAAYQNNIEQVDGGVIAFRSIEHTFAAISLFAIDHQQVVLVLMLLLSAGIATVKQHHIAFRSIETRTDHWVSLIAQALANTALSFSAWKFYQGSLASGVTLTHPEVTILILCGAAAMALINIYQLFKPVRTLAPGGSALKSLLSIPIYTFMLLAAANHFFLQEGHYSGIAIFFTQLFQLTGLYLQIALYIWVGMLLKQTQLGERLFALFKPWHLPPEILAVVAIALMAIPTAYTGASGIIIIALGSVVYAELRRVGTRRQLALAVTAMTGSSGVVLRPCLLVIGIAMLNKEVVTDDLFYWGGRVFVLTLLVFLFYALITKKERFHMAPLQEAWPETRKGLALLLPYIAILLVVIAVYAVLLNAYLDEFSAPIMLPVLMLAFIAYEAYRFKRSTTTRADRSTGATGSTGLFNRAVGQSVNGAAIQIGALLMVMACSFAVGGMLERGDGSASLPTLFESPLATMGFLVVFLVFIGMIMDPFGALILVTTTLAPIAYANGINPIHFWMTCLVAFELGYLSPPVSLNHLLTRQVLGAEEIALAKQEGGSSFYYRHERMLLPLLVMGTTLVIVAFGPLTIG